PTPTPVPTPTPLPTPRPTPTGTPIPLEMYSTQVMNLLMPADTSAAGVAEVQYMSVSSADSDQSVILGGWAYLYDYDAEQSTIYLVVSSRSGSVNRFYETVKQPGFAGVIHEGPGTNLERADFRAAFSVKTYEEGAYKLGALVEQPVPGTRNQKVYGYYEFGAQYDIYVRGNKVIQVG
ncbi:MAG: hypothetical protein Q4D04_08515, partial [Clostridia bacterium]|nr:hypothetical protein [Clostridia bacterium]